ncbi:gastrula zinc finger protein XlCGF57.1-like [Sander lucioperca]|uniref:gastrula zinc finger protein XlCGF57.1-like n=1 Tax=Sander lucioperca TaxID=283035 RepID=UPI001653480F|nr:gastrula zinc finger protein XlCGF57.1-like [Sander lucioperca]
METEADGEDCGGPEPARNSHPHLQPETEDQTGDSSEPETDDSADWKETREPQSALNSRKHDLRHKKTFSCSECGRRFGTRGLLYDHMRIHPREKKYSCSVCNKRFIWRQQVRRHECVNLQSSQLHQSQTEENRETEPPASRETQHMETEADGEDCGGPEPARNSHPHPLLQQETEDQTGDSSEPETDDRADWKETRDPQSALNSLKHDSTCKKTFSCSECGKRFGFKSHLKKHMRFHTGEKPFSCSVCKQSFTQSGNLQKHMKTHTGEKPFSCSVCKKSFKERGHLRSHMAVHTGEKRFSCSVCNKRFSRRSDVKTHKCVGPMETEADGEDCGGPEPARNSHPLLQPETEDQTGDSSEPEADDSADWKETREPQSALNSLKNTKILVSHTTDTAGKKLLRGSECWKRLGCKTLASCTVKKKILFSCSVCDQSFTWYKQLRDHQCVGGQNETEENREAAEDIETDGDDCGGPEPARNSHPLLHPETEDQTGDSSEPETDDSADWKETREPQSALNSLKHDSTCSEY